MQEGKQDLSREELFRRRAAGVLPQIDIAGTAFIVDWRLMELREHDKPWNRLDISGMEMKGNGDEYYFLYDQKTHQEFQFDESVTQIPESVVFVTIPDELKLDPYAAARDYTDDVEGFIKTYPIHQDLKATVMPVTDKRIHQLLHPTITKRSDGESNDRSHGRGR